MVVELAVIDALTVAVPDCGSRVADEPRDGVDEVDDDAHTVGDIESVAEGEKVPLSDGVSDAVPHSDICAVVDGLPDSDGDSVPLRELEEHAVGVFDTVAHPESVALRVADEHPVPAARLPLGEPVDEALRAIVAEMGGLRLVEAEPVTERLRATDAVEHPVPLCVSEDETDLEKVSDEDGEREAHDVVVPELHALDDALRDVVKVPDTDAVVDAVRLVHDVDDAIVDADEHGEMEFVAVSVPLPLVDGEDESDAVAHGDEVSDRVMEVLPVDDGTPDCDVVNEFVPETESVPADETVVDCVDVFVDVAQPDTELVCEVEPVGDVVDDVVVLGLLLSDAADDAVALPQPDADGARLAEMHAVPVMDAPKLPVELTDTQSVTAALADAVTHCETLLVPQTDAHEVPLLEAVGQADTLPVCDVETEGVELDDEDSVTVALFEPVELALTQLLGDTDETSVAVPERLADTEREYEPDPVRVEEPVELAE